MVYKSLLPPLPSRPPTQAVRFMKEQHPLIPLLQVNIPISLWICIGAVLQSILVFLPLTHFITYWRFYAVLPAFLYILFRLIRTFLISYNFVSNPYLEGSIGQRVTALVPDIHGNLPDENDLQPNKNKVAVLFLSARFNHPLGVFASPESGTFNKFGQKMFGELEKKPQVETGFLGHTSAYIPTPSGVTEACSISYWRSADHIHKYAASDKHIEAIHWWNRKERELTPQGDGKLRHIGIMHEIFEAPAGCWESIYLNHQPSSLGATRYAKKTGEKGEIGAEEWISPIVDARRGRLRSSKGRLGRDPRGDGRQIHEKEGEVSEY